MSGPSTHALANMTKGFRLSANQRQPDKPTNFLSNNDGNINDSGSNEVSSSSSSSSLSFHTRLYQDLTSELIDRGRGKRIKDWKGHLSLLRELTVFLTPRDVLSVDVCEALNATLLQLQENQLSSDVGKKLFRLTCHILFDNIVKIANHSKRNSYNNTVHSTESNADDQYDRYSSSSGGRNGIGHSMNEGVLDLSITSKRVQGVVIELFKKVFNAVEKVDDNTTTSTKIFFCWRLLGSFVGYQTVPSELSNKLIEQVTTHLKFLTFPEKKKATLLSGLGNSAHTHTSVFSDFFFNCVCFDLSRKF